MGSVVVQQDDESGEGKKAQLATAEDENVVCEVGEDAVAGKTVGVDLDGGVVCLPWQRKRTGMLSSQSSSWQNISIPHNKSTGHTILCGHFVRSIW